MFTFLFPPAITIRKAPKNSTAQPHFNLTIPAKVSCQDLNGKKLKYCSDCIFTATKVNPNKRISRIPKNLTIHTNYTQTGGIYLYLILEIYQNVAIILKRKIRNSNKKKNLDETNRCHE